MSTEILDIASEFRFASAPVSYHECTEGHINGTYFIDTEGCERYVLQRINTSVFKDPDGLMKNVIGVTGHIRRKLEAEGGDVSRGTLNFILTKDGKEYYTDPESGCWRAYVYVGGVMSLQSAASPELFEQVGHAFGHFQMQLADYDASGLCETIPNFHNTPSRYADFEEALSRNAAGRAASAEAEIEFVRAHREVCSYITDRIASGAVPLRVTHNDTKLNNILIDQETGKPMCVIDLDTVMPGSVLFDFGDAIRFGASSAAEDETDLSRVYMREDMFEAFARGFVSGLEGSLSDTETEELPMGALIITLETGIRFLTDYLNGDTYFRIHYPQHNIDRARNQFALVADMEKKLPKMFATVRKYL